MNYANDEKLRLLEWLLPNLVAGEILAAELPFNNVRRKADVAILNKNSMHGIEVKGPRDRIDKLYEQVLAYRKAFHSVDVAAAERHVASIHSWLPKDVGIIALGSTEIRRIRKPRPRKYLDPEGSLQWLYSKDLLKLLGPNFRKNMDQLQLQENAEKLISSSALSLAACTAVYERSKQKFDSFMYEKSDQLNQDDVAVLQLPQRIRRR